MPAAAHRRWALGILLAVLVSSCLHNAAAQSVLDQLLGGGAVTPTAPLTPALPGTDTTTTTPAAATVYCNMTPTWFPKGYENSAFPPPLWLDNQVAAGYNGSGDPLRVALANYGNPKFYLGVNWFMLQQNKVPADCASSLKGLLCSTPVAATPPTTVVAKESALGRRLLQTSTVLTPVTYEITWTLNDGPKQVLGTYKPGQNRAPPFIELDGYSDLTDGDYCVNARITALARSGSLSVGGKAVDVPCKNITETQMFCFTKVVKRPYTKVKYHSCNKNFTVDFTGIIPAAQYSSVATVPPTQLYSVLIHFYGNASRDDIFDNRTADERPTNNFVDETIEISDPLSTKYTFSTDNLLDGKYIFHVQMLLKSALPGLCNLSGPTFNEDGTATYQGWLVNGTKGDTVTVYHEKSDVFGEQCPDDAVVALPAERVFQWQYLGSGTFNCYIDGVLKNNGETCSSPYTLNLKDKKNHTLTVVFNDVCKQSIVKKFVFGHWGCLQDKRGEPPSPPPPPPPPPEAPPADGGGLTNPFGSLGNISLTGNTSAARPAAPLAAALWLSLALLAALAVLLQ